ncbi:MAG: hypothetical protein AB7O24_04650 [Kofleriaceae bacterium]
MPFPWLSCTQPRRDGADHRTNAAIAELTSRAGLLYRLGFSEPMATHRLIARVAWEFEPTAGSHRRPAALSDQAIGKIVSDAFAKAGRRTR